MNTMLPSASAPLRAPRIASVDAVRGLVMFTMIYVNDIASASREIVPWWMRHYRANGNGMTFVDLVFPAFLFIVGMSIPLAFDARLGKDGPWKSLLHILVRTLSLLFLGILMVNEQPDSGTMGWSGTVWSALMFFSAILAFCSISPPRKADSVAIGREQVFRRLSLMVRVVGLGCLVFLAFAFRGSDGQRIISLSPFSIRTSWYGILGLIGWAYLVASVVFLLFRGHRTAILGSMVLLFCLYPADRTGLFEGFWLARYVGIGGTLGSQAAISVAGLLLASILVAPDTESVGSRSRFTLLFIAGCSVGALLLHGLYGINKNAATPSWCLWACAITAAIWLLFYLLSDVLRLGWLARPFSIAGQNVLLAYLLHNAMYPTLELLHLDEWYFRLAQPDLIHAVARSAGCAVVILALAAVLNRAGFRL